MAPADIDFGGTISGISGQAIIAIEIIGIMILVFGALAFVIVLTSFRVKVLVYEQTGMGVKLTFRKAKKIEKISGNKLKFMLSSDVIALPTGNYFFPISKKQSFISLYKDKSGNFHPVPLRWDERKNPLFVPDDSDMRFWLTNHLKEAEATYKSEAFWAKYGHVVVLGGVIAFALIILIIYGKFFFDSIEVTSQSIGSSVNRLEQTLRTIGGT